MVSATSFCIAYVIVDVLCFVLTFIIASNVSRDSGSELQVRYFFFLLTANQIFLMFDALWAILMFNQLVEPGHAVLNFVNGINLIAIASAGYFWFGFSLVYFENKLMSNKLVRRLTALPVALAVVLHIIGSFTGQNVIFHPDGSVTYGAMHTVITLIALAYLAAAAVVALQNYFAADTRNRRRMSLVFILFTVPPVVAGVFDMFVPNMPIAAAGMMVSISYVMMAMQESRISSDALTGLNNRRRADSYLEESMAHASPDQPVYLFIIDMDKFKSINDTYGHLEGDHALQMMADALRAVSSRADAFAARWGGDEFVLVSAKGTARDPETVVASVKQELEGRAHDAHLPYHVACSVGYAKCDSPVETSAELVSEADEMLYQRKRTSR